MSDTLDISRLEKVRKAGGKIIARCPACAENGKDGKGEHLSIWPNGSFTCVQYLKDQGIEHRKRIFALVGVKEKQDTHSQARHNPRVWDTAEQAAKLCYFDKDTYEFEAVFLYPRSGKPFGAVGRYRPIKPTDDKTFLQFHATSSGWQTGAPSGKWPLYEVDKLPPNGTIVVTEGEKCQQAAASIGLAATTSSGGSGAPAKSDWTPLAGRNALILPDHDEPGEHYAETIADILSKLNPPAKVKIVRLPGLPDSGDIVQFLEQRDAAEDKTIRDEILKLADSTPEWNPLPHVIDITENHNDTTEIQARFWKILKDGNLERCNKLKNMAAVVLEYLHRRGRFFFHADSKGFSSAMYFDSKRKLLLRLADDEFKSWLSTYIGSNRTEPAFKFIFAALEDEALTGKTTGLQPEMFWASRPNAIYLSNGNGQAMKITAGKVELVDNGTDDVLFAAGRTLRPWKLTDPQDPVESCRLFSDMQATANHAKDLFRLWLCSLPTNQRCKPPLTLTGVIGSGKTRIAVGLFDLFGITPRVTAITKNGEDDFWTEVNGGGLVCFDNADTRIDWLPDALAGAATDVGREKRQLYTDSTIIQQKARAWVIVTSSNPTFASDPGLADRILVIRLERRTQETAESALSDEILQHRDAGLSWLANTLSTALADNKPVIGHLNQRHPDFATFAVKIGRAIGREQESIKALKTAESDKSRFNLENDDFGSAFLLLMAGCEKNTYTVTTSELLEALKKQDGYFDEWTSKKLAKRIQRLWPHLESMFRAKQDKGHAGFMTYVFYRNGDYGDFERPFSEKS